VYQSDIPIACALNNRELAQRRAELTAGLFRRVVAIDELPDGYAFSFASSPDTARELLDFTLYERECCAFLIFELVFERDHGSISLRLRGGEGVKEFVHSVFVLSSGTSIAAAS
jgi:hypothetical protein